MKFLVFGGTGFVGRNLVNYINSNGGEAVSASRSGRGEKVFSVDITDATSLDSIDFLPDIIINCASIVPNNGKSSKDPQFLKDLFLSNTIGAVNIANWAVKNQIDRLLNCSTLVVVKKPWPSPLKEDFEAVPDGFHVGYSMSKLSQEKLMNECVNNSNVKLTHLRLSAVYGEGMVPEGFIFHILKKLENDEDILLLDAQKNTIDLIHVRDVCRCIYTLAKKSVEFPIINLASGRPCSIYDLTLLLKEITGSGSKILNTISSNSNSEANVDITRLKQCIGTVYDEFISLKTGLEETVIKLENQHHFEENRGLGSSERL